MTINQKGGRDEISATGLLGAGGHFLCGRL